MYMKNDDFDFEKKKTVPHWIIIFLCIVLLLGSFALLAYYYLYGSQLDMTVEQPVSTPSVTPILNESGVPVLLDAYFLDVGNGNCVVVQTADKRTILFDGGHEDDTEIIESFLKEHEINRFDMVFATSSDNGHIGGLAKLLSAYPTDICYLTEECSLTENAAPLMSVCKLKKIPTEFVRASFTSIIPWAENVELRVLSPHDAEYTDKNDLSIMVHIGYGTSGILLAGDAHKVAERLVVKAFPNKMLKSNVLLIGDHGDSDATSSKFLSAVKPKIAVISCGKNNPPSESVLDSLKARGCDVYLTDIYGNIHITLDGVSATVIE